MMQARQLSLKSIILSLLVVLITTFSLWVTPAWASLDDDRYDGNVFVLYAGNGSLVPARLTLKESRERNLPTMLVFYADDSRDSKRFAPIVSEIQSYYEKVISIIPVAIDAIPVQKRYTKDDVGYYYKGKIPQTVILNEKGKVVFDEFGQSDFNKIDNAFRKMLNRPLREGENLKKPIQSFNEYNSGFEN